jgi:hypothetical protein
MLLSPPPDEGRSVADAAAAGMPSCLIIAHEHRHGRCRPASSAAAAAAAASASAVAVAAAAAVAVAEADAEAAAEAANTPDNVPLVDVRYSPR